MNRLALWIIVVGVATGIAVAGSQEKPVTASDGWVKLPAAGETTTEAFAVVENPTMYDVYLIGAAADVAGRVEFRDAAKGGDRAAQTVAEVTVPAYGQLVMAPDGIRLALIDLKRPIEAGEKIPLTLKIDQGDALTLAAVVK